MELAELATALEKAELPALDPRELTALENAELPPLEPSELATLATVLENADETLLAALEAEAPKLDDETLLSF